MTRLGPYEIRSLLWEHRGEKLLSAFDPILHRQVWIHLRPLTAEPLSAARRDLSRPGRLRWLTGGRTQTSLWDAYDAVEGRPLLGKAAPACRWKSVRFWLLDLCEELEAALADRETVPILSLERVWLTPNGRALVLDFPVPGLDIGRRDESVLPLDGLPAVQQFLHLVARHALFGPSCASTATTTAALPLHARHFLDHLAKGVFTRAEFILGNLHSLIAKPAEVTPAWRAASLALVPAMMVGVGVLIAGMVSFERIRWDRWSSAAYPEARSFRTAADLYETALDSDDPLTSRVGEEQLKTNAFNFKRDAELTRIFIAHHFAQIITNDPFWGQPEVREAFSETTRSRLQSAVIGHPQPNNADLEEAERVLPERLEHQERQNRLLPIWILLGIAILVAFLFALAEFAGALGFGQSPLLRLFGLTLVDRGGERPSRRRLVWRWLVTWGFFGLVGLFAAASVAIAVGGQTYLTGLGLDGGTRVAWIVASAFGLLLLAWNAHTIRHPSRSLQDRLAATWVVPR